MTRRAIDHALAGGELERAARGLYRIGGSPNTETQRALVAATALRGALSNCSATAWWRIPGFDVEPFDVMRFRPGSTERSTLAQLHQPVRLLDRHLTSWRGVPVTRPARTLFDLAATEHPARTERAYDTMWARGLVTHRSMTAMLQDLQGRGRPGIQLMRELIDARAGRAQPTGSRLEKRFSVLNERAGIPMLRRQVEVGDEHDWIGRMDFAGDERALIVEIDSAIHHAALLDAERDASVTSRLESAGYSVLRIDEDDLWFRSTWVVDELRRAWWSAPKRRRP